MARFDGVMLPTLDEDDECLNGECVVDASSSCCELSSKRLRYQERREFYKNFSILLHLGDSFMKRSLDARFDLGENEPGPRCQHSNSLTDLAEPPRRCQMVTSIKAVDSAYLRVQRAALKEVDDLLGEYEKLASLYPSLRAMQQDVGEALNSVVSNRINVLYAWRNIVTNLNSNVIQVADMLSRVKKASAPACYENSSRQSSPFGSDEENLHIVTINSFLTSQTLYKQFVVKNLKLRGMRKKIFRVESLLHACLQRAGRSLQLPGHVRSLASIQSFFGPEDRSIDAMNYGFYNAEFKAMTLPSYFPTFLYLIRVPLNIVHEWLKLRIQQETCLNPDPLSLDEENVILTVDDSRLLEELLYSDIHDFTEDLSQMFDIYLDFFRMWVRHHHAHLYQVTTEFSQSLLSRLESEWVFAKKTSRYVLFGEADAAKRFCCVCNEMVQNIEEFVEDYCDASRLHQPNGEDDEANEDELSRSPTIFFPQRFN
ncbi:unnamed protein product [Soboliphyme baturini]|uniref:DUF2451 domain-containing protein n=1 Tax=Soboliphyme baturini TaxID=241478 RepID=A0A183IVL1_9BILA|nr:unnamed protein product [Soboliphyme baturini]